MDNDKIEARIKALVKEVIEDKKEEGLSDELNDTLCESVDNRIKVLIVKMVKEGKFDKDIESYVSDLADDYIRDADYDMTPLTKYLSECVKKKFPKGKK